MSNVDKVFEMLGVKPNEEFYIRSTNNHNICVSDIFYFDERLKLCCKNPNLKYDIYLGDLFNGKYVIVQIPKPLLTDEEREFLKNFMFDSLKKVEGRAIIFYIVTNGGCRYYRHTLGLNALKLRFNGLEFDKEYTKEELGL